MKFTPQRSLHSIDGVNYSLDFLESMFPPHVPIRLFHSIGSFPFNIDIGYNLIPYVFMINALYTWSEYFCIILHNRINQIIDPISTRFLRLT